MHLKTSDRAAGAYRKVAGIFLAAGSHKPDTISSFAILPTRATLSGARPGVQSVYGLALQASSITFRTWSMVKLAGFIRGGNSLNVARNWLTRNCPA